MILICISMLEISASNLSSVVCSCSCVIFAAQFQIDKALLDAVSKKKGSKRKAVAKLDYYLPRIVILPGTEEYHPDHAYVQSTIQTYIISVFKLGILEELLY